MTGPTSGTMDRRSFVRSAAMASAGAAMMPLVSGCAEAEKISDVPCLAKVDAPAPQPGMKYIRASEIGCALDCDLTSGQNIHTGGSATDDGPKINAALAGATAANPITLVIDGGALVSGLFLPAGGHWSIAGLGCGTGFYIKTGTNSDGIRNAGPGSLPDVAGPAPARGSSVSLSNFTLNGNQGNGHDGNSTSGNPLGGIVWLFGINLMNLDNITITNVVVVQSPSYHLRLSNVGNVTITGCVLHTRGPHTDGIHFDGPANDLTMDGCDIVCDDDAIALNCPEGYTGDIERVSITNCTFNSFRFLRVYVIGGTGNPSYRIRSVAVNGCSGASVAEAIIMGEGLGTAPQSIDDVTISNCTITAPAAVEVASNFGTVTFNNLKFTPAGNVGVGYAMVLSQGASGPLMDVASAFTFNDCSIVRQRDVPVVALLLQSNTTITVAEFNGFSAVDPAGSNFAALPGLVNMDGGFIGQLGLDAVSSLHISGPVCDGDFAGLVSVAGSGVLATGWKMPDALMANGSPYLSANSGQPSVKNNGVVKPYP